MDEIGNPSAWVDSHTPCIYCAAPIASFDWRIKRTSFCAGEIIGSKRHSCRGTNLQQKYDKKNNMAQLSPARPDRSGRDDGGCGWAQILGRGTFHDHHHHISINHQSIRAAQSILPHYGHSRRIMATLADNEAASLDWVKHSDEILDLLITQNKTVRQVMEYMEKEHNFKATYVHPLP